MIIGTDLTPWWPVGSTSDSERSLSARFSPVSALFPLRNSPLRAPLTLHRFLCPRSLTTPFSLTRFSARSVFRSAHMLCIQITCMAYTTKHDIIQLKQNFRTRVIRNIMEDVLGCFVYFEWFSTAVHCSYITVNANNATTEVCTCISRRIDKKHQFFTSKNSAQPKNQPNFPSASRRWWTNSAVGSNLLAFHLDHLQFLSVLL